MILFAKKKRHDVLLVLLAAMLEDMLDLAACMWTFEHLGVLKHVEVYDFGWSVFQH